MPDSWSLAQHQLSWTELSFVLTSPRSFPCWSWRLQGPLLPSPKKQLFLIQPKLATTYSPALVQGQTNWHIHEAAHHSATWRKESLRHAISPPQNSSLTEWGRQDCKLCDPIHVKCYKVWPPPYGDRKQVPVRDCRWEGDEYNQYPGCTNGFVDTYTYIYIYAKSYRILHFTATTYS